MLIPESAKIQYFSTFVSRKINEDNVYIYGNGATSGNNLKNIINLKFKFIVSDDLDNLKLNGFWFNNQTISKYLKYRIYMCFSQEEAITALSYDKNNIVFDDNKYFDLSVDNFKKMVGSLSTFDSTNNNSNKATFYAEVNKNIFVEKLSDINFLALVCHTYLDQDLIANDFNVNFTELVGVRSYFFANRPTVKTLINDSLVLTDANLTDISGLENLKNLFIQENSEEAGFKQEYFSDLFASHSFETIFSKNITKQTYLIRYGFFFDHLKLVEDNTIYKNFLKLPENSIFRRKFIERAKILNAKVTRLLTKDFNRKDNFEEKIVSNTFTSNPAYQRQKNPETGLLEDVIYFCGIDNLKELLFIAGTDSSFFSLDGEYKYRFDIEIIDPAYSILSEIKKQIERDLEILQNYKTEACLPILQAENIFNINPYIDSANITFNTNIASIKTGYFIPEENRFSDFLKDSKIEKQIKNFIDFFQLFSGSDFQILSSNGVTFDNIKSSIGRGSGNPENLQLFIENYRQLLEIVNSIFSKKITSNSLKPSAPSVAGLHSINAGEQIPSFIQTIKQTITFDNFSFKAGSNLPVSFQYFTSDRSLGLKEMRSTQINNEKNQLLENIVINQTPEEFYKLDILNDLQILKLIKDLIGVLEAKTTDPNLKNVTINLLFQALYMVFAFLDILLTIKNQQEFNAAITKFIEDYKKIPSNITEKDFIKFFEIAINIAINVFLNKNQISTKNSFEVLTTKLIDNLDLKVVDYNKDTEKLLQATETFKALHNLFIASGINNASERINKQTIFENKINYYIKDNPYVDLNKIFIKEDNGKTNPTIEKSGRFKIKVDTLKIIKYIDFEKTKNGRYLLKSPVLKDFYTDGINNNTILSGKYLGFFQKYINNDIKVNSSLYKDVDVLDQYFYLNFDESPPQAPDINVEQPPPAAPEQPSKPPETTTVVGYPNVVLEATVITPSSNIDEESIIQLKVNNIKILTQPSVNIFSTAIRAEIMQNAAGERFKLLDETTRLNTFDSNLLDENNILKESGGFIKSIEYFIALTPKMASLVSDNDVDFYKNETMFYLYALPVLYEAGKPLKTIETPTIDWARLKQLADQTSDTNSPIYARKGFLGAYYLQGTIIKQEYSDFVRLTKSNFQIEPYNDLTKNYGWTESRNIGTDNLDRFIPYDPREAVYYEINNSANIFQTQIKRVPYTVVNQDGTAIEELLLLTNRTGISRDESSSDGLFTMQRIRI